MEAEFWFKRAGIIERVDNELKLIDFMVQRYYVDDFKIILLIETGLHEGTHILHYIYYAHKLNFRYTGWQSLNFEKVYFNNFHVFLSKFTEIWHGYFSCRDTFSKTYLKIW